MKIRAVITIEMEVHDPFSTEGVKKGLEYMFEPGVQMELEHRDDDGNFIDKVVTMEPITCTVVIDG